MDITKDGAIKAEILIALSAAKKRRVERGKKNRLYPSVKKKKWVEESTL